MTKIIFEGEHKTTAMNMIQYLLQHDGHFVERDEEEHTLTVEFVIGVARCFGGEIV